MHCGHKLQVLSYPLQGSQLHMCGCSWCTEILLCALTDAVSCHGIWTQRPAFGSPVYLGFAQLAAQPEPTSSWRPAGSSHASDNGRFEAVLAAQQHADPGAQLAKQRTDGTKRWAPAAIAPDSALQQQLQSQRAEAAQAEAAAAAVARPQAPLGVLASNLVKPRTHHQPAAAIAATSTAVHGSTTGCLDQVALASAVQTGSAQRPAMPVVMAVKPALKAIKPALKAVTPALKSAIPAAKAKALVAKKQTVNAVNGAGGAEPSAAAARKTKPAATLDAAEVQPAAASMQLRC